MPTQKSHVITQQERKEERLNVYEGDRQINGKRKSEGKEEKEGNREKERERQSRDDVTSTPPHHNPSSHFH